MTCASCGSPRVYPSRLRNAIERLREAITAQQPHRCHQCGRRWWTAIEIHIGGDAIGQEDLRTGVESTNPSAVLDGDIDRFIEAALAERIHADAKT